MKKRLDHHLVERKLAVSRTRAQDLIRAGVVRVQGQVARSPSLLVEPETSIEIASSELNRYVSRGGLKLEAALRQVGLAVPGWHALDVGNSTGGFSDCLLQAQVESVLGVDVGHDQLHPRLASEPRLKCIEGVNARELSTETRVLAQRPEDGWDLIVVDVSFISLTLILPQLPPLLRERGELLALVKPQFEVGPEGLGKGGLVKDPSLYAQVENKIRQKCLELELTIRDYFQSSIEGKDGNREYFISAQKISKEFSRKS